MKKSILLRDGDLLSKIDYKDILYVEKNKDHVRLVTDSKAYTLLVSFRQLAHSLPGKKFSRVHRRYLVSTRRIKSINIEHGYLLVDSAASTDSQALPGVLIPIEEAFYHRLKRKGVLNGREGSYTRNIPFLLLDALINRYN